MEFYIHVNTFWEVFQSFLRNIYLFTGNVTLVRIMLPYSICSTVDFPFSEEGIFRSDFILTSSIFDTQKVTVAGHQSFARLTAGSFLSGISDIRIEKVPQGRQIRFQHSYIARIAEDDSRYPDGASYVRFESFPSLPPACPGLRRRADC